MLHILLADDHALFRDLLQAVVKTIFPASKITAVGSWQEVNKCVSSDYFDLLLLDQIMPVDDNNDTGQWETQLSKLMERQLGAVCIISASANSAHVREAFKLGVNGYICKTFSLEQMQQALRMIGEGKNYLPEELIWKVPKPEKLQTPSGKIITWRQQEVLELLAAGNCNKKIASKLELSESTIKRHAHNLYRALGAKNRADAIRLGRQQGLLD